MQNHLAPLASNAPALERREPGATLAMTNSTSFQLDQDRNVLVQLTGGTHTRSVVESIVESLAS